MITEQELELAIQLNKDIRELKITIVKLEEAKIAHRVNQIEDATPSINIAS